MKQCKSAQLPNFHSLFIYLYIIEISWKNCLCFRS